MGHLGVDAVEDLEVGRAELLCGASEQRAVGQRARGEREGREEVSPARLLCHEEWPVRAETVGVEHEVPVLLPHAGARKSVRKRDWSSQNDTLRVYAGCTAQARCACALAHAAETVPTAAAETATWRACALTPVAEEERRGAVRAGGRSAWDTVRYSRYSRSRSRPSTSSPPRPAPGVPAPGLPGAPTPSAGGGGAPPRCSRSASRVRWRSSSARRSTCARRRAAAASDCGLSPSDAAPAACLAMRSRQYFRAGRLRGRTASGEACPSWVGGSTPRAPGGVGAHGPLSPPGCGPRRCNRRTACVRTPCTPTAVQTPRTPGSGAQRSAQQRGKRLGETRADSQRTEHVSGEKSSGGVVTSEAIATHRNVRALRPPLPQGNPAARPVPGSGPRRGSKATRFWSCRQFAMPRRRASSLALAPRLGTVTAASVALLLGNDALQQPPPARPAASCAALPPPLLPVPERENWRPKIAGAELLGSRRRERTLTAASPQS